MFNLDNDKLTVDFVSMVNITAFAVSALRESLNKDIHELYEVDEWEKGFSLVLAANIEKKAKQLAKSITAFYYLTHGKDRTEKVIV